MNEPQDPSRPGPGTLERTVLALAFLVVGAGGSSAQETTVPDLPHGPYFGQSPPGAVPQVFAPGIVSLEDRYEYVIGFSPDGTECCFGVTDSSWSSCNLYYSSQDRGVWSIPAEAHFQQGPDGWLPSFTPDGKWLLFSSGRPSMQTANSWMCERTDDGWGAPGKLGAPLNSASFDWRPTATSDGTLYFTSDRNGGEGASDIYRSVPTDGEYRSVENLGPSVNSPQLEASPFILPDEQCLTIESWRPGGHGRGDLYICYLKSDGSWTVPQNLGPLINTEQIEDGGYVSPDGKYFFFNRRKDWVTEEETDIYWVDMRAVFKPYVQNAIGETQAVVGEDFVLQLPAEEFADHDDDALVYSAAFAGGDPLPAWLSFDPKTRTLTGTPAAAGTVALEITATDSMGAACSDVLTIRVGG